MTDEPTSTAVAKADTPHQEVERLADLPLAPGLPNSRELASMNRLAHAYSLMPGLGKQYKGNPGAVMAALLTAHSLELPLNPVIVNQFYEVNGNLFPSTQILIALAARKGVEVWFDDESNEERARAFCRRSGSERVHAYTYTLEMAKKAKLADKDVWKNHGDVMLRYRAASRLLRTVASDVVLGIDAAILDPDDGIATVGGEKRPVSREALQAKAVEIVPDDDSITDAELVEEGEGTQEEAPSSAESSAGSSPASDASPSSASCGLDDCTIDEPHRHDPATIKRSNRQRQREYAPDDPERPFDR